MSDSAAHFDREPSLDPVNGYPERDLAWFASHVLPDFLDVVGRIARGGSLLDVGCASGYFTRVYAQSFEVTVGIDISPMRIAKAREMHYDDAIFDVCDIVKSHPNRQFDVAVSSAVFQHIDPKLRADAFKNVRESLKSGGYLILYDALHETQADAPEWDGFTSLLGIEWLRCLDGFRVYTAPRFIAVDGGGFDIYRTVLVATP